MCVEDGKLINLLDGTGETYEREEYNKTLYSVFGHDAYVVLRPAMVQ